MQNLINKSSKPSDGYNVYIYSVYFADSKHVYRIWINISRDCFDTPKVLCREKNLEAIHIRLQTNVLKHYIITCEVCQGKWRYPSCFINLVALALILVTYKTTRQLPTGGPIKLVFQIIYFIIVLLFFAFFLNWANLPQHILPEVNLYLLSYLASLDITNVRRMLLLRLLSLYFRIPTLIFSLKTKQCWLLHQTTRANAVSAV